MNQESLAPQRGRRNLTEITVKSNHEAYFVDIKRKPILEKKAVFQSFRDFLENNGVDSENQKKLTDLLKKFREFILSFTDIFTEDSVEMMEFYCRGSELFLGFFEIDDSTKLFQDEISLYFQNKNLPFLGGRNIDFYINIDREFFLSHYDDFIKFFGENLITPQEILERGIIVIPITSSFPKINIVIRFNTSHRILINHVGAHQLPTIEEAMSLYISKENKRGPTSAKTSAIAPVLFVNGDFFIYLELQDLNKMIEPEAIYTHNIRNIPIHHSPTSIARITRANACYHSLNQEPLNFKSITIRSDDDNLDEVSANFLVALLSNALFTWLSISPIAHHLDLAWIQILNQKSCEQIDSLGDDVLNKVKLLLNIIKQGLPNIKESNHTSIDHELLELLKVRRLNA